MEDLQKQITALKEKKELTETVTGEGENITVDIMHNNDDGETIYVKLGPGNETDVIQSLKNHFKYDQAVAIPDVPGGKSDAAPKGRGRVSE